MEKQNHAAAEGAVPLAGTLPRMPL